MFSTIQAAFESQPSDRPGIEVFWEHISADLVAAAPGIEDEDLREYSVDTFEVEDMIATAGPDIWA
jgi:hypothetical protein